MNSPVASNTDAALACVVLIGAVANHWPVAGLNSSHAVDAIPPATSTFPDFNKTAEPMPCGPSIAPVFAHCPLAGSNTSAEPVVVSVAVSAASTLPLVSNVALCAARATFIEPVTDHVAVPGSYSSAEVPG